jgi:outer membrane protein TolC
MSCAPLLLALALAAPAASDAPSAGPLTLEEALAEARAANARLPVAALSVDIANERTREARAEKWLKVAVSGDFIYPSGYDPILTNLGESRLQVGMRQPIYDGGALRAAEAKAEAQAAAAGARYRISREDVDLEVRTAFSEVLEVEDEIAAQREGLERLRSYRLSVRSRQAEGQGVTADLLRTDVRVAGAEADLIDAERRLDEARMTLNDLIGREPAAPLRLAPLPPPEPPAEGEAEAWNRAPELTESLALTKSAVADLKVADAERRPHLLAAADVGFLGSDTTHLIPPDLEASNADANFLDRAWRDFGFSLGLYLYFPLWDTGGYRARVLQAQQAVDQARAGEVAARRLARLNWERAHAALKRIYEQIRILSKAAPDARDSYLEAESRYRGGAATSLEVLDAYSAAVDARLRLADAVKRFRVAQALEIRWGGR